MFDHADPFQAINLKCYNGGYFTEWTANVTQKTLGRFEKVASTIQEFLGVCYCISYDDCARMLTYHPSKSKSVCSLLTWYIWMDRWDMLLYVLLTWMWLTGVYSPTVTREGVTGKEKRAFAFIIQWNRRGNDIWTKVIIREWVSALLCRNSCLPSA